MNFKKNKYLSILFLLFISFFLFNSLLYGKPKILNKDPLVEIQTIIPDVVLDVRYASFNNFLKKPVYSSPTVFVRYFVARKIEQAAKELRQKGFRLKIFDGYRPLSVQQEMWKLVPDSRYVADPSIGSFHNRGGAVDLTLITLNGKEVEMPSDYDDFSEKAHHDNPHASLQARQNANLLRTAMEKVGLKSKPTEWWHYDDGNKDYPVLNVSIEDLKKPIPIEHRGIDQSPMLK